MPNDCVTIQNSGYFSNLIIDYLNQDEIVNSLYNRFPSIENFKFQIEEKFENYSSKNREILVSAIENQYKNIQIFDKTSQNISLLKNNKTFTITTGHQLNLFTGPIYFIYKIISIIKLASELKKKYPEYDFVPIYWMATEDHDFEEINHFNLEGKKISWKKESKGPVGRFSTDGLQAVFDEFSKQLNTSQNANELRKLFEETYLKHSNLAEATRYLVNQLFSEYGLVIVDGDDKNLKKIVSPYFKNELINQQSFSIVNKTSEKLKNYTIQVNPREINLFYILDDLRERIVFENGIYNVINSEISFSKNEILEELENHPERFSPNVILRPLYQEIILPNLCYIGGGGEIAYWLQLKEMFHYFTISFPILKLRNSALLVSEKQVNKKKKLNLNWNDLFLTQNELLSSKTKEISTLNINFSKQKEFLHQQFIDLIEIAKVTDKSFIGAVRAQEAKQIKGLENLEKRLLKAEKKKHNQELSRITELQNQLFPTQSLQERKINFSEIAQEMHYSELISKLYNQFSLFSNNFEILMF